MTRVLVVDDHHIVRAAVVALLAAWPDLEVVGEAGDGREAVELAVRTRPDVVLMDLSMPAGLDGVAATEALLRARPDTAVVVLSSAAQDLRVTAALAAGAVGYLLKDSEPEQLVAAVRAAAAGGTPIDPRVAHVLLPRRSAPGPQARSGACPAVPHPRLSEREHDVLRLVHRGMGNKQVADALRISESTVKAHLGNAFRSLGVSDRRAAAALASAHLPGPGARRVADAG